MKISVALACFNGSEFVVKQLESLKNQSRTPDEVIISDDASTDNTAELVRDYIDKNGLNNWHLSVNGSNLGYIGNFRKAMSICSGDVVFLCDQDDIWDCDKLRIMSDVMEKQSNVLSLASGYDIINRFGEKSENKYKPLYKASVSMKYGSLIRVTGRILQGNVAQGCACAHRKSLIAEYLEKDKECVLPHDWALNLLAFERRGLYFLNFPLISYRVHGDNTAGAISADESVMKRVQILRELAEKTGYASSLVPDRKQEYLSFAEFIRHRELVAESARFSDFIKGFFAFPQYALGSCFFQYCKDFFCKKRRSFF